MNESDFNEHRIPPGGWRFRQPETKWVTPTPIASTLSQTVELIRKMRLKNPAIVAKFKLATNPEAIKAEVIRYNRKINGLPEESTPLPFSGPHSRFANAGRAAVGARGVISSMSGLKRAAQGTAVVLEWLGSGANPVAQELAEKRAEICVACPKNEPGSWYTEAPAELIKKAVESWKTLTSRTDFEFTTNQGENLKSCGVCKCLLSLKVFCPMEHILKKTTAEVMAELPSHCWIAKRDQ